MERIVFGKYSGLRINGKIDMPEPGDFNTSHFSRASWLTAQVESGGKFGTVMNYDGTGMTAGIHQAIAVYPRALDDNNKENDQGPLWKLLCLLKEKWLTFAEVPVTDAPWNEFEDWLGRIGIRLKEGKAVNTVGVFSGKALRLVLTGDMEGVLPVSGVGRVGAESVIKTFYQLFSAPWTFPVQLIYGIMEFVAGSKKKFRFSSKKLLQNSSMRYEFYRDSFDIYLKTNPSLDLALCVYWSNSVNAPGYALKLLCKVLDDTYRAGFQHEINFPKKLIHTLGTAQYGRWDDDIPNGRYQRTRNAAMKKWPNELFVGPNAVMPKDLVG